MIFNLASVVNALSSHTITVRRFNADTYTEGYANPRTSATFTARASVQPNEGEDLERNSDGTNSTETATVWCTTDLRVGDRITVPSLGDYEVEKLLFWLVYGGYCKVKARKLDDAEPRP